jgi:hypothetical protein
MAAIQPTMVIENKLRRAMSVMLACLRFTAIKIGIALMAIIAKSSNVLIGGRPMAENSPSITPTSHSGRFVAKPEVMPVLHGENQPQILRLRCASLRMTAHFSLRLLFVQNHAACCSCRTKRSSS